MTIAFTPLPAPLPDVTSLPADAVRHVVADVPHSYPCRRCLRDAEPGDALVLLSYDPFLGTSPYRQPGPVYVHAAPCGPDAADVTSTAEHPAPAQLLRRRLSVRGFDADHLMVATDLVDGPDVATSAARMLTDASVAYIHVHNAAPGCFAVRIDRA